MTDSHGSGGPVAKPRPGMLSLEHLRTAVGAGEIDTVTLAFTDMQGRLAGKRLSAEYFLDEVAEHFAEGCNYLLAVDVDMNTVGGYEMSSWERGYGDFVLKPDLTTLRRVPWLPSIALILADLTWLDGTPVVASPRQMLSAQIARLAERGWVALAGTELEFIVYRDSFEQAADKGYANLVPANQYNVDYSILGTSRIDPLLRRITARHGRGRACTSSRPRASATSASTRSRSATPTRSPPATTTRSTRPAPRRSRRRRACR